MKWTICFILALICICVSIVFSLIKGRTKHKKGSILEPSRIFFAGVLLSSFILFIPIYLETLKNHNSNLIEAILMAIHNVIRLFVVDGDITFITENIRGISGGIAISYTVLLSIMYLLAPIFTFGFVLSFFKNISANNRYKRSYHSEAYIFSELNEKSITLAENLSLKKENRVFVFTDVYVKDEEECSELMERAKAIGAICFKKDILSVNFGVHSKRSKIRFFTMGIDENENIDQSLKLIKKYNMYKNVELFVFSTKIEAEVLLSKVDYKDIKVRRINEVKSLVYRTLTENGHLIFENAVVTDDIRNISAVIIGMGQHGTEMLKALSWFCQMDGYKVEINAFELDRNAESKFILQCPELMDEAYNGKFDDDGESQYKISIHSGIDINKIEFVKEIEKLKNITYVFISLGGDEINIRTAILLRTICERMGINPQIQTIISNSEKKKALGNITNYSGQPYNIEFIGDIQSSYSEEVIMNSEIEKEARDRHIKWGDEDSFWRYEYNYRSSIASAIHKRMKIACKIPGIELSPDQRKDEDRWAIRRLEHRRWNTYMRSEGYVYSPTRNNLAKQHNCLVTFDELSQKDKEKDDD